MFTEQERLEILTTVRTLKNGGFANGDKVKLFTQIAQIQTTQSHIVDKLSSLPCTDCRDAIIKESDARLLLNDKVEKYRFTTFISTLSIVFSLFALVFGAITFAQRTIQTQQETDRINRLEQIERRTYRR